MIKNIQRKCIALLLTVCMLAGCFAMLPLGSSAAEEKNLVTDAGLKGYAPNGNPKTNPSGAIGAPANVLDDNAGTVWGWGFESGMHLISTFVTTSSVSSIYLGCKIEGGHVDERYGTYKIEYLSEDDEWVLVDDDFAAYTVAAGGNTCTFDTPVTAAAVKITITDWKTEGNWGWGAIAEMKVMGSTVGADTYIGADHEWQYYYFTEDDAKNKELGLTWEAAYPEGWQNAGFDTANWLTGAAPFTGVNYANAQANTKLDVNYLYFLHAAFVTTFTVENVNALTDFSMLLYYDENPVVYLNGVEVYRGTGYNTSLSLGYVNLKDKIEYLKDGENTIAVQMENAIGGGGFNFDMRLEGNVVPVKLYNKNDMALISYAKHNGFQDAVAAPENMYDNNPDTCAGKFFENDNWFEFVFNGKVELNYLYLEVKNEFEGTGECGMYGHYAVYAPDESGEYVLVQDQIPAFNAKVNGNGAGGCYLKLDETLTTKKLRIEITDWTATGGWANISQFSAWRSLDTATVTFEVDGEEVVSYLLPAGDTLASMKIPAVPEKEGYTDGAWSQELAKLDGPVTEDITITAVYAKAYETGDINGDGIVSIRDVSQLLMYMGDSTVEVFGSVDINGDGNTTMADATALLLILQGK